MKAVAAIIFGLSFAASADVGVVVYPNSPAVYLNDLEQNPGTSAQLKANGPWLAMNPAVYNQSPNAIELKSLQVLAKSPEGRTTQQEFQLGSVKVQPGETKQLGQFLIGDLPAEASLKFDLTTTVRFLQGGKIVATSANNQTH